MKYIAKFSRKGQISPIIQKVSDNTWWFYTYDWKGLIGPFNNKEDACKHIRAYRRSIMRWRKDKPKKAAENVLVLDNTGRIWFGKFVFSVGINSIQFITHELATVLFLNEIVAWCNVTKPKV